MYTPTQSGEGVIIYDEDGNYTVAEYLGEKGDYGEHFKVQRQVGPRTTSFLHYEDIYQLNDENRNRLL